MTPSQRVGINIIRKLSSVTNQHLVKKGCFAFADEQAFNSLIAHLEYLIEYELKKSFPASILDPLSDLHWRWQLLPEKTNFIHGYPVYTLALILFKNHQPNTVIMINAADGSEYLAADGNGAVFGNQRIRVNDLVDANILYAGDTKLPGQRRDCGSSLMSIALTARGSLNTVCYSSLNDFEMAFARLLLQQSGARCYDFAGNDCNENGQLLAGNSQLVRRLLIATFGLTL